MTLAGIPAVARQEFTVRIRKGRWRWLLAAWFLALLGLTAMLRESVLRTGDEVQPYRGAVMYGGLMLIVLSLGLLVAPALTAQSVNGDRERGTLATLQVTRLSPLEITLGKFVAAWGVLLVFLAVTAPLVVWCVANGGVSGWSVVVVTSVMAVLLAGISALALGLSAVLSRSTTSGVLSYLSVFGLTVGTLILFGLSSLITQETYTEQCDGPVPSVVEGPAASPVPMPPSDCSYTTTRVRTDRTWVLLAPNPFVVLADAAPYRPRCQSGSGTTLEVRSGACDSGIDPLGGIGRTVRDLRAPELPRGSATYGPGTEVDDFADDRRGKAVWPTGLAMHVVLAAGMLAVTARRLRTPSRELARGQRVA